MVKQWWGENRTWWSKKPFLFITEMHQTKIFSVIFSVHNCWLVSKYFQQVHLYNPRFGWVWIKLYQDFFETLEEGCWKDFLPKPLNPCATNGPVYYDVMQFSVNSVHNDWTLSTPLWFGVFIQLHGTRVNFSFSN